MKFLTSIWIVLITITVGVGLRVFDVDPLKILRLKTFDYYQKIQPRDVTSNHFIIVEVTEQDLKRFGQWPWSRSLIAEIHSKLIVQNVNTIQYNILFSEPDRLNPKSFTDNYKIDAEIKNELMKLPSNDQYLSQFFSVDSHVLNPIKTSIEDSILLCLFCLPLMLPRMCPTNFRLSLL